MQRSLLHGFIFFDFLLILIVPCRTRGILDGFWCEGRKFTLTLTLTTETPINRAFQTKSDGVRVKKEKLLLQRKAERVSLLESLTTLFLSRPLPIKPVRHCA